MGDTNSNITSEEKQESEEKEEENYERNLLVYNELLSSKKIKNEKMLFHGTSLENIGKIIHNGFNRDFNQRSRYGQGTYFTNDASIAFKYAKQQKADSKYYAMLACKVIVGQSTLGRRSMDQTSLFQPDGTTLFDSLVNDMDNPSIFVINRDYHAMPLYVLIFN